MSIGSEGVQLHKHSTKICTKTQHGHYFHDTVIVCCVGLQNSVLTLSTLSQKTYDRHARFEVFTAVKI
jgi:hypothetical protein